MAAASAVARAPGALRPAAAPPPQAASGRNRQNRLAVVAVVVQARAARCPLENRSLLPPEPLAGLKGKPVRGPSPRPTLSAQNVLCTQVLRGLIICIVCALQVVGAGAGSGCDMLFLMVL